MRIAYLSADRGVPVFGAKGNSVHVQEMIRAFGRLGHELELFAAKTGGEPPADLASVSLWPVPEFEGGRPPDLAGANERTAAMLGALGPFDLIYERYSLWSHAGMTAAAALGIPGILEVNAPLIAEQHRYRPGVCLDGAAAIAERAFEEARAVVAVSRDVAAYVRTVAGPAARVTVIPNGVDPQRFRFGRRTAPSSHVTIGFVGTMKQWHGLDVLVEAFRHLATRLPAVRLLMVGDGPDRGPIAAQLDALGLANRVEWTGAVPPSAVPELLARMDVAVAPYPSEADSYFSPLKVFEYLAAGRPVVASRVGQLADVLIDGRNALLVEPGNPFDLAAAIERLATDRVLRHRLAGAGRVLVESVYTWERAASRVLELARSHRVSRALTGVRF